MISTKWREKKIDREREKETKRAIEREKKIEKGNK